MIISLIARCVQDWTGDTIGIDELETVGKQRLAILLHPTPFSSCLNSDGEGVSAD